MNSSVKKHSIKVGRHKTSISLEDEFWTALQKIARGRGESLRQLIASIDEARQFANLSSAVRMFVLRYYRDQLDQQSGTIVDVAHSAEARHGM
jgi:predicted DNA-binding ribbon-helix-helix protein